MASLPIFTTTIKDLSLMQTKWASQLNPLLSNPLNQPGFIKNVTLIANTPLAINHLLGQVQQGWFITDIDSNATVWRTQPFNKLTLTLEASANTTINLTVY